MDVQVIAQQVSAGAWQVIFIFAIVMLVVFIAAIIAVSGILAYIKLTYKTKVRYYPVYGNPKITEEVLEGGKKIYSVDTSGCLIGKEKVTSGKHTKKKGSVYFKILRPRRTIPQIEQSLITQEGIYMLLVNNMFIPIYKPITTFTTSGKATMSETIVRLYDLDKWITRRKLMIEETENKYPERDAQIRILALFIIVLVLGFVFWGFMLYLSYRLHSKTLDKADQVVTAISGLGQKMGITVPN